ncbi:DUF2809 domain-containing protein [Aureibaculum sp. 2210JD6-5]|uniref:ribosomal maturation YjgA family protein n=1 Tax=Aureibaculum sp. 2210JD6-5 TaxID=3103957 RepID=UPI002AAD962D|nr:DUF2809 domain-containing protein [Aureibaculum sp. 2210JD6-5]MDY7395799.1 DUF2809 domain-containing protein [Aureibaculum sp. 2210JD6-5]
MFNKAYFILAIILLAVEIYIGVYVKDSFVRPYFGDFLVVILIYCTLKSFWNATPFKVAIYVLLFSFVIEFLKYFKLVEILRLQENKLASIVIGTSFSWHDLVAYFLGIVAVLGVEYFLRKSIF